MSNSIYLAVDKARVNTNTKATSASGDPVRAPFVVHKSPERPCVVHHVRRCSAATASMWGVASTPKSGKPPSNCHSQLHERRLLLNPTRTRREGTSRQIRLHGTLCTFSRDGYAVMTSTNTVLAEIRRSWAASNHDLTAVCANAHSPR